MEIKNEDPDPNSDYALQTTATQHEHLSIITQPVNEETQRMAWVVDKRILSFSSTEAPRRQSSPINAVDLLKPIKQEDVLLESGPSKPEQPITLDDYIATLTEHKHSDMIDTSPCHTAPDTTEEKADPIQNAEETTNPAKSSSWNFEENIELKLPAKKARPLTLAQKEAIKRKKSRVSNPMYKSNELGNASYTNATIKLLLQDNKRLKKEINKIKLANVTLVSENQKLGAMCAKRKAKKGRRNGKEETKETRLPVQTLKEIRMPNKLASPLLTFRIREEDMTVEYLMKDNIRMKRWMDQICGINRKLSETNLSLRKLRNIKCKREEDLIANELPKWFVFRPDYNFYYD